MGFLDTVKSRFKNHDEEDFERAFREGSWPEGVDNFEPLATTGSLLPVTPDVDPLADESLPGNRLNAARNAQDSVDVRSVYAAPVAASPFTVIDGTGRPRASADQVSGASAAPVADGGVQAGAFADDPLSGAGFGSEEEGVQVVPREEGHVARSQQPVEQKPFADRLRERVAAVNVSGQADETLGRSSAAVQFPGKEESAQSRPMSVVRGNRRAVNASEAELEAELEERRRARRQSAEARMREERREREEFEEMHVVREREARAHEEREQVAPTSRDDERVSVAERPAARPSQPQKAAAAPGRFSSIGDRIVRPRTNDDVRDIAQVVMRDRMPVVIALKGSNAELTRRILDFSFGLCCGTGANMKELADRVYAVLPQGTSITPEDTAALRRQGILRG